MLRIEALIGRPAERGAIGEFLAQHIFGISLATRANQKGSDGRFQGGPHDGRSVNIKWYGVNTGLLDLTTDESPDLYLVLTGPWSAAGSSRGAARPLVMKHAYLFESADLLHAQRARGAAAGLASSVPRALWDAAEIFPARRSGVMTLTDTQYAQLVRFQNV